MTLAQVRLRDSGVDAWLQLHRFSPADVALLLRLEPALRLMPRGCAAIAVAVRLALDGWSGTPEEMRVVARDGLAPQGECRDA